ncbi:MAG: N-acetyl-lysine deacetylase [uncultured Thermomicrobiales bacterium]|uniref:N-acetyl-lysine deacetylase n=1 Tax=uncultured Thermomicrobiales bacterium TaxID=1645740 RepID=A0A6J4VKY2_9BACT|nr:MAG: N-acetyl-lysine deacetylase [uncultured Thermomicrobiales bacterium]
MALSSPPETTAASVAATGTEARPEDVALLRRMVAVESLSGGEGEAVDALCQEMAARGFRTEKDAAGNAVGRIGAGPRRIVLLGHIDTVPGRIPVRIEHGVLHGRGAVDAKGPLCAFVAAAAVAAARANAELVVVGAVGEERIGSPGASAVAAWPAPDFCLIGEPSGWDALCLGYRGTLSLLYRLRRAGRHTAGPGESVAEEAVAFWNAVVVEVGARNAVHHGAGTFTQTTPTLRAMGTTSDGLFDEATLSIGLRLPPGVDVPGLLSRLRELAGDAALEVEGSQEGYRSDKRSPLVPPFLRAIRAAGGTPRFTLKLGTSDMTVVGPAWNCPIVAYGPGDAALDHTPEERLPLADYARAIAVLTDVLVAL